MASPSVGNTDDSPLAERHVNGHTVLYGPNPFEQRPQFAVHVANVIANWGTIEADIMLLYAILMGRYAPKIPGTAPPSHPLAFQIFDALQTLPPRLDLLNALAEWMAQPEEANQLKTALKEAIRARHKERSIIAHGQWGLCEKCPDSIILAQTFGGDRRYREHDFRQVNNRLVQLHADLVAFTGTIYQRFSAARQLPTQEKPDSVN